jgi:hypothetical protein
MTQGTSTCSASSGYFWRKKWSAANRWAVDDEKLAVRPLKKPTLETSERENAKISSVNRRTVPESGLAYCGLIEVDDLADFSGWIRWGDFQHDASVNRDFVSPLVRFICSPSKNGNGCETDSIKRSAALYVNKRCLPFEQCVSPA